MNAQTLASSSGVLKSIKGILDRTILHQKTAPYILVLPFLLSFGIFFLYPFINAVQMSTLRFEGLTTYHFVGLDNFRALNNPRFFQAVQVTMTYTFWTILILVPMPLFLAVLINSKLCKGATFFKSTFFIPQLTSVIVAGMFFRFAFSSTETALLNTITGFFGAEPTAWLFDRIPAMITMVTLCVWRWFGINLIYFLASLQTISPELYEASSIDGAGAFKRFIHITLPGLKPVIVFVIAISVFGGFSMFAESYALYGSARTPGDIASTMIGYIYSSAFVEGRFGLASAAGMVLLGAVMVINLILLTLFGTFKRKEA